MEAFYEQIWIIIRGIFSLFQLLSSLEIYFLLQEYVGSASYVGKGGGDSGDSVGILADSHNVRTDQQTTEKPNPMIFFGVDRSKQIYFKLEP